MTEKKPGAVEPLPDIAVHATEIPVARSRAVEPYIKTFAFRPENVTQEHLGTLVGVFSVFDRSESSAYTVNVIASVAKKEYYANPRRGAIESFESTLHRINLALSELVKNGQTDWMGSLHGAIAVVEKRNIHFSATGNGGVFLFREATISDIGDGLASEEAGEHPLKTFLEISSGRLMPGDCVLLSTPELFGLFSARDLERNANRLLPEKKFTRFLETAMVNELRVGGAIILDVDGVKKTGVSGSETKRPKKRPTKTEPVNAWSEKTFREAAAERTKSILESHDPEADIAAEPDRDAPPTHEIRIQGEALENADEHPIVTKFRWMIEDTVRSVRNSVTHSVRKTRKRSEAAFGSLSEAASASMENRQNKSASRPEKESAAPIVNIAPERCTEPKPVERRPERPRTEAAAMTTSTVRSATKPSDRAEKEARLAALLRKETPRNTSTFPVPRPESTFMKRASEAAVATASFLSQAAKTTRELTVRYAVPASKNAYRFTKRLTIWGAKRTAVLGKAAWDRFLSLPQKQQIILATIAAFLVTGLGIVIWKNAPEKKPEPAPVVVVETPVVTPFPPSEETNASLTSVAALPMADHDIVSPVYLGDSLFLVTRNGVFDTAKNTTAALPTSDAVRLAGGMEDLGLIFLLTDGGDLYSFAPGNRTFVKNSIPFPSGFKAAAMGDFLTYLYFLEEGTGRIYRFPRADGGFGEGIQWTKSTMPVDTNRIAVSENIYGAGSALTAFFRGNPVSDFSLQQPATPFSITSVCANSDVSDRLVVLDAPAKRILIVSGTGTLVSQLFNEAFASATACALSGNGSTVAVSGGTSTGTVHVDTK
ncbi:MAG: hypothetical protein HGB37_01615 [Candidatus Moranbacteria bacterium]|nr:hypothetical protein [Candidatus Moranbacteria bacterium]